jgi:hypothetical protein
MLTVIAATAIAAVPQIELDARVCILNASDRDLQASVETGVSDVFRLEGVVVVRRGSRGCIEWSPSNKSGYRLVLVLPYDRSAPLSLKMQPGSAHCSDDRLRSDFKVSFDGVRFNCVAER